MSLLHYTSRLLLLAGTNFSVFGGLLYLAGINFSVFFLMISCFFLIDYGYKVESHAAM